LGNGVYHRGIHAEAAQPLAMARPIRLECAGALTANGERHHRRRWRTALQRARPTCGAESAGGGPAIGTVGVPAQPGQTV